MYIIRADLVIKCHQGMLHDFSSLVNIIKISIPVLIFTINVNAMNFIFNTKNSFK